VNERLSLIADRLEAEANQAQSFVEKQQKAYDKWLTSRKGGKPWPVGCLPLTIACMQRTVREIREIVAETEQA
jgi:hypothetical protein